MLSLWLAATTAETPPVFQQQQAPEKPIGAPCFPTAGGGDLFAGLDLTGKTALVTGSNGGIGSEIAVALAAHGAQVILTWRKPGDCLNQTLAIKKRVPNAYLKCPDEPLDLSSFSVVRKFAKQFPIDLPIDMLINDAAMPNNLHGITTIDGMEMAFQVDYASTWLLTDLLLPQLRVAKGRVINLVSKAYRTACLMSKRFDCAALKRLPPPVIQPPNSSVPILNIPVTNYGIAKLLMVRWTEDLARREAVAGTGVTVYSVDPGFVNTSMSKGSNLSPYFEKLACTDEGRTGAPCPTNASQGALTPVFLAIAPEQYLPAKDSSGKFFEWCAPSKVEKCIALDHGKLQCQLALQSEQEALWNLTAKWVANFTDSGNPKPEPPVPAPEWTCPKLLEPFCKLYNQSKCFSQCSQQMKVCAADATCRAAFLKSFECFAKAGGGLECLVPDNFLRDDVFQCLLDDHDCIKTPPGPVYPACRDTEMAGDAKTTLADLKGDWWKVRAWTAGEPYECNPCGKVSFSDGNSPQNLTINSSWLEKDMDNKLWPMTDSSVFGIRADGKGFPQKLSHTGKMLGLSYDEDFTILHDGRHEEEPFIFFYGCGATKQGKYTTAWVAAKTKTASVALEAKIKSVAAPWFNTSAWCVVDNTCAVA